MSVKSGRAASKRPRVWLVRWHVMRTNLGTRHFVGHSVEDDRAYVSTPIVRYDVARRTGVTSNGRPYTLVGPSGYDEEAEFVWCHYVRLWGVTDVVDVSDEYLHEQGAAVSWRKLKGGNGSTAPRPYEIRRGRSCL